MVRIPELPSSSSEDEMRYQPGNVEELSIPDRVVNKVETILLELRKNTGETAISLTNLYRRIDWMVLSLGPTYTQQEKLDNLKQVLLDSGLFDVDEDGLVSIRNHSVK